MAKNNFFDPKKFDDPIKRAKAKILSKFGASVRAIARSKIKIMPEGVHSSPGSPPYSHEPEKHWHIKYRDTIFFFHDRANDNVIIGAVLLTTKHNTPVPKALEFGGDVVMTYIENGQKKTRVVNQPARPHMRRAFEIAVQKMLPALIEYSIVPTGSGA